LLGAAFFVCGVWAWTIDRETMIAAAIIRGVLWCAALACGIQAEQSGAQVSLLSNSPVPHSYVVVAHADDWQIFMGDVVAQTLQTRAPTTFIYLTAGDDGRDSLYWETRERAALASTRVAAGRAITAADSLRCASAQVLSHSIQRCSLGSTTSYFLRLPDGKRDGSGFARYGHQSMRKMRSTKTAQITTVDSSTTYHGWKDLVATVDELMDVTGDSVVVHTMDPKIAVNPHDHSDHRSSGLLVTELKIRRPMAVRFYVGYALATRANNRSNKQARVKTATFAAYEREMMRGNRDWSAYREHPAFYSQCMLRTYARWARP